MKTIVWKHNLSKDSVSSRDGRLVLTVPEGAKFLSAGVQHQDLVLWFQADPDKTGKEHRVLFVVNTGDHFEPMASEALFFLATVTMPNGVVCHIFDVEAQ